MPSKTPPDRTASHQSFAEHYALINTAEVSLFSFQVGMIQMAADKNNVKKNKPNKRLYTRTYVYCKQKQKQNRKEREGKRENGQKHNT